MTAYERRVFASVFPTSSHTTPTPEVSPYIGAPASPSLNDIGNESIAEQVAKHSLAWSVATRWLSIPDSNQLDRIILTNGLDKALDHLLHGVPRSRQPFGHLHEWFVDEYRRHYEKSVKPQVLRLWQSDVSCGEALNTLDRTLSLLDTEQSSALQPIESWLALHRTSYETRTHRLISSVTGFRDTALARIHIIVLQSLPIRRFRDTLAHALHQYLCIWTSASQDDGAQLPDGNAFMSSLCRLGLGQDEGQRALACAVKAAVNTYANGFHMKVDWVGKDSVVPVLRQWIENRLEPAMCKCLYLLTNGTVSVLSRTERDQWHRMAMNSLGRLRTRYLLRYVQSWSQSMGAILDLKEYISTPEAKIHLANSFCRQMIDNVLHAGVKTSELLSIYVNLIHVFKTLDTRGVLLEKVAQPLRAYLREREDSVKVIAASFLADVDDSGKVVDRTEDVCADITKEVIRSEEDAIRSSEKALDFDDMEWMPDPIDAGPDFKKSKGEDIISYMLTLFEQDSFIKEVQSIFGERLLRSEAGADLEKEVRLVELFKSRLGQDKLQQCEVMLRDTQDSARIMQTMQRTKTNMPSAADIYNLIPDEGTSVRALMKHFRNHFTQADPVQQKQFFEVLNEAAYRDPSSDLLLRRPNAPANFPPNPDTSFYAQVLSSFFWPALREESFTVPPAIAELQSTYERDFERIKTQRKLNWLSALGRVSVELELEDRTVGFEGVHTWQASVIYTFQSPSSPAENNDRSGETITKTVDQLSEQLEMDDLLVRNAINFWLNHRILTEVEADTYAVLERLPSSSDLTAPQAPAPVQADTEAIGAVKSANAVLRDNKDMYEMFVIGMLTNGGAMDASRVAMMMKMVVPDGFPFGNDEVAWLLTDLVQLGKVVEIGAGVYGIKK